ncbi:RNA polymerase sigma factor [Limnoglobus roseus]|uniref:RNA polymerase sigma-70 region 2 domain-containing protein n=1 Tax=Limnoglobus roseus TaxID=2598579 RepID=A0A5C1AJD3_9BACT|nr:sigma-70 family RNA polymerase sigma factor [Limnoglobus roseus]QEL18293.1 hypothetical protein PX52LOC_05312 [Limnoglobus roseus]
MVAPMVSVEVLLEEVDGVLRSVARRAVAVYGLPFDDVLQDARAIIVAHAPHFDPARNQPRYWARRLAQGAVRDGIVARMRRTGGERGASAKPSAGGDDAAALLERKELRAGVRAALASLPARQGDLLARYFGIDAAPEPCVQALAREFGLCRRTVRDQLELAKAELRRALIAWSRASTAAAHA